MNRTRLYGLIAIAILALIIGYSYITVSNGPIQPLGRLSFVKVENPDMYPGHPHSVLLAQYAQERGSQCALVVHFAGSSNYRSYEQDLNTTSSTGQNGTYIIEVAYIDTQGGGSKSLSQINFFDSFKVALFGVPDGRYKYMSDGVVYNNYTSMMNHVETLAQEHGQKGPIPMVWHGTVRTDSPFIDPGCGFPLYFQIMSNTYGLIPAYTYMIYGLIFPYLHSPYWQFELSHSSELQTLYNTGQLDYNYVNATSNVDRYYQDLSKQNLGD
ncbi:MAG: hypothetical protein WCF28_02750 [Methanobacterium sp.]|uniref:hypothetical protein n=1 Tax=Methanobacterium sp. TaxID=2164 RepID=UPI003C78440E